MAGERFAKLTVRVALSHNDNIRGQQTVRWRFGLGNQVIEVRRGGQPGEFVVPDPDNSLVGEQYVLQAVQNALSVLNSRLQQLGLPYVIGSPRQVGTTDSFYDGAGNGANGAPKAPIVEFTLTATQYGPNLGLSFTTDYNDPYFPNAFQVTALGNVSPILASATVVDATFFGATNGSIRVTASSNAGGSPVYLYTWSDGVLAQDRLNVGAGTYVCLITNGSGASATVTAVVHSDARLDVQVQQAANNVLLVISGGLAPYAIQWADGPTTPERTNLAPGVYPCTVTDSRGIEVTVTVTVEALNYFYWSRNPVALRLTASNPAGKPNLRFLCEVWLEQDYLSGTFLNVAGVLTQPADSRGETVFDVSTLLDAYVGPDFPAWGDGTPARAERLFKRFYLQHSEQWDGSGPPTYTVRQTHYLLYGGLDFDEYATQSYFTVYRPTVKPFLNWEPAQKEVFADQPEYLYYQHNSLTDDYFGVQLTLTLRDGQQLAGRLHQQTGVPCFEVWRLAVGLAQVAALLPRTTARPADVVAAWDVTVVDAAGLPLSETRTYQLSDELPAERRYFLYASSLGGLGTLATVGKGKLEVDFSSVVVQRALLPGYDAAQGETYTAAVSALPVLRVNTGQLLPAQLGALRDCLLSEEIRLHDADRYRAGSLQPLTSLPLADDDEAFLPVELAFVLPTWHRYTPTLPLHF